MTSDLLAQLQRTLGDAYALERELGGGGMSRVFVAEERALGRKVVVKVLPPDLAAEVSADDPNSGSRQFPGCRSVAPAACRL